MAFVDKGNDNKPASNGALLTPNDATDLVTASRALWVGGAGNIKVTTTGEDTFLLSGIPAGTLLPIRCSRVWSTTTTATLIVALW